MRGAVFQSMFISLNPMCGVWHHVIFCTSKWTLEMHSFRQEILYKSHNLAKNQIPPQIWIEHQDLQFELSFYYLKECNFSFWAFEQCSPFCSVHVCSIFEQYFSCLWDVMYIYIFSNQKLYRWNHLWIHVMLIQWQRALLKGHLRPYVCVKISWVAMS